MRIKNVEKVMKSPAVRKSAIKRLKRERLAGLSVGYTPCSLQQTYNSYRRELAVDNVFSELEELGYVRFETPADEHADLEDLKGDCYNPDVNDDIPRAKLEREEKEFEEKVNREGVYGIVGEFRISKRDKWEHADSCWGFVGDDWKGSGYDTDIKRATITALRAAFKSACPHCGKLRTAKRSKVV